MSKPLLPFVATYDGGTVSFMVTGELDHPSIAVMLSRIESSKRIVLDMTHATGAYSTLISACIQLATRVGSPVSILGATRRFEMTLQQMNLRHLITIEGEPRGTTRVTAGDVGKPLPRS